MESPAPRLIVPPLRGLYERLEPLSWLLLRAGFGLIMVTHGLPKVLGISHGSMADPMAASTHLIANVLHLPAAPVFAWFVALLESVGGLLLALGFLTRPIAAMMAVQTAAICYVLAPRFPWIDRGFEYPLLMCFVCICLALRGGGRASVDWRLGREF
jgi:putative oxidoreductase